MEGGGTGASGPTGQGSAVSGEYIGVNQSYPADRFSRGGAGAEWARCGAHGSPKSSRAEGGRGCPQVGPSVRPPHTGCTLGTHWLRALRVLKLRL